MDPARCADHADHTNFTISFTVPNEIVNMVKHCKTQYVYCVDCIFLRHSDGRECLVRLKPGNCFFCLCESLRAFWLARIWNVVTSYNSNSDLELLQNQWPRLGREIFWQDLAQLPKCGVEFEFDDWAYHYCFSGTAKTNQNLFCEAILPNSCEILFKSWLRPSCEEFACSPPACVAPGSSDFLSHSKTMLDMI